MNKLKLAIDAARNDDMERVIKLLEEALAEPELNLNCKSVQKRLATVWGYVKAEQAEQEPYYFGLTHDHTWLSIDKKQYDKLKPEGRMACYIAPVRTKDLSDYEIAATIGCSAGDIEKIGDARAVIAAYKEKNK